MVVEVSCEKQEGLLDVHRSADRMPEHRLAPLRRRGGVQIGLKRRSGGGPLLLESAQGKTRLWPYTTRRDLHAQAQLEDQPNCCTPNAFAEILPSPRLSRSIVRRPHYALLHQHEVVHYLQDRPGAWCRTEGQCRLVQRLQLTQERLSALFERGETSYGVTCSPLRARV